MAGDIVTTLRSAANNLREFYGRRFAAEAAQYDAAADEIERLRSALTAARREGQEEMRTRAAAACLRRAHASAEDDLTPIEEAVRDEAIYCARAIRALEIEG
jgi:hypothetical protein